MVNEDICSRCPEPLCINGCPYKEISWDPVRREAPKCDFCLLRLQNEVAPACVRQCPGRAIWIDYLDNREGVPYKLVNLWQVAMPLHPEWGTESNVHYVPPLAPPRLKEVEGGLVEVDDAEPRIPLDYLMSLFGPGVEGALTTLAAEMQKQRRGERSELMVTPDIASFQHLRGAVPQRSQRGKGCQRGKIV